MVGMKPGLGARVCPRCGTRVDERRGKFSPYCLSCGQPLNNDRQSMAAPYPAVAAQKKSSALPWVIGLLCCLCLIVGIGITIFMVKSSGSSDDDDGTVAASPSGTPVVPSVERGDNRALARSGTAAKPPPPPFVPVARPTALPTATDPATTSGLRGPFQRDRANARVDQVMATLSTCKRSGDPTGSSTVGITFENDGRVGTTMRRPFAGTPTGDCISQRFLALQNAIPRFDGNAVTITRGFTIAP